MIFAKASILIIACATMVNASSNNLRASHPIETGEAADIDEPSKPQQMETSPNDRVLEPTSILGDGSGGAGMPLLRKRNAGKRKKRKGMNAVGGVGNNAFHNETSSSSAQVMGAFPGTQHEDTNDITDFASRIVGGTVSDFNEFPYYGRYLACRFQSDR
jgi:hypothetical protein